MITLGITGRSGCGKSTVTAVFAARNIPLALVPTAIYGSIALWANYQRLWTGPYPFLLVYEQTPRQTVLWCACILAGNLICAALVWWLGGNSRKRR
mgnify:CR=1 FL=1